MAARDAGQARRHLPAKPYRVPRVPTVSPESRTRSDDNRVPVSPPLRGNTDTGHGNAKDTTNRDRVPDDLQTRAEDIINRWGEPVAGLRRSLEVLSQFSRIGL